MKKNSASKELAKKQKQIKSEISHYSDMVEEVFNHVKNGDMKKITKKYLKSVDYEKLIKESLSIIIPLLAIKFISSKGKPSPKREEILDFLVSEAKNTLKKKKII